MTETLSRGFATPTHAGLARPLNGPGRHSAGVLKQYDHDQEIYSEGEEAHYYYKVVSGVVRMCKYFSDGHRQIDIFYGPEEIFGLEPLNNYCLTAEAASDCRIVAYRRTYSEFSQIEDAELFDEVATFAMDSIGRARNHAFILGRSKATEKVSHFLVELVRKSHAGNTLQLNISRQDIADYLGLTIETVSRTLSQFAAKKLIAMPTARQVEIKNLKSLEQLRCWT